MTGSKWQVTGGRWFIAGLVFLGCLILYLSSLAPSVVTLFDDSLEFQLVTYQLGIAHPTGYPLYTLLGKLFTFLPIGNVAFRVNVMSAVFAAGTVSLVYLLIVQLVQPSAASKLSSLAIHLGGVSGALLLATSLVFWQQATIAEVYPLNTFFIVLLLYLAIRQSSKLDLNSFRENLLRGASIPRCAAALPHRLHRRPLAHPPPHDGFVVSSVGCVFGLGLWAEVAGGNSPHPQPLSPRERDSA